MPVQIRNVLLLGACMHGTRRPPADCAVHGLPASCSGAYFPSSLARAAELSNWSGRRQVRKHMFRFAESPVTNPCLTHTVCPCRMRHHVQRRFKDLPITLMVNLNDDILSGCSPIEHDQNNYSSGLRRRGQQSQCNSRGLRQARTASDRNYAFFLSRFSSDNNELSPITCPSSKKKRKS